MVHLGNSFNVINFVFNLPMITGYFQSGGDVQLVIVDGNNLMFCDSNRTITTIEGLRFNYVGVVKEFPNLENDEEWKKKAIERFKEHIKKMETEREKLYYIKDELEKFGYVSLYKQVVGFRPQKF